MSGGGGRNRSLKTDYDPYSKEQRKGYQRSLEDFAEVRDWLSDQAFDWGESKEDAGLGNRLTRSDFQKLVGGADAENLFNSQQYRPGNHKRNFGSGGLSIGRGSIGALGLAGMGSFGGLLGGGGRGDLFGNAIRQLEGGLDDDEYMEQIEKGELGFMDAQTMNDITRREGFSDVAPFVFGEDSAWGGKQEWRNPYSIDNQDYYKDMGGREQVIKDLGEKSHWAHQAVSQRGPEQDYWAWTPPEQSGGQSWYQQQGWDDTHEMTQIAQGDTQAQTVPDEDQDL